MVEDKIYVASTTRLTFLRTMIEIIASSKGSLPLVGYNTKYASNAIMSIVMLELYENYMR
jgi:hypothetical protein